MFILSHDICWLIWDHDSAHPSIISDFHLPVDFRLDILFPDIFWFLHQNWVGTGGFTLTKPRSVGDEEKTIPSGKNTSSPIIDPPATLASGMQCKMMRAECVSIFQTRIEVYVEASDSRLIAEKLHGSKVRKVCSQLRFAAERILRSKKNSGLNRLAEVKFLV
jgi:hypothetical protein